MITVARGDEAPAPQDSPADAALDSQDAEVADASDASAPPPDSSIEDAADAHAQEIDSGDPANSGFAFGVRAGVAFPLGRVNDRPITDVIASAIPFTVDVGYFVNPHLYVGVFGTFAFVTSSSADTTTCPNNADCTARRWRVGAMAAWHFRPRSLVNPFVSVGAAYDLVNLTASDSQTGDVVESSALQGFEIVEVHTGLEIRPKPFWGFGPYVNGSAGVYASSWNAHGWLGGGLRFFSVL